MLKVGDFSQLGQVSVRTLHHYDERGLLKPVETDPLSNYRFYSLDQLPRLNRILALKDLGLSLDEISLLMEDELPPDQLRGLLKARRVKIEHQLREDRTRLARVEARLRQIEHEDEPSPYEVTLKEVRPETVISARQTVPSVERMPDYRCDMFRKAHDWLEGERLRPAGPELALYHSTEYKEENIDMEAAVPVNRPDLEPGGGLVVHELPGAPDMATTVHHGPFWGIPGAIVALFAWIGDNGYQSAGPVREIHLFGRENDVVNAPPAAQFNADSVILEMQIPVEEASS
ncbi:MAG: MerR family transcriptional regulator [Rubrobacteraceae bacterium]